MLTVEQDVTEGNKLHLAVHPSPTKFCMSGGDAGYM